MTKYYLDTEFSEEPGQIVLISIALVCQDGREYYAADENFSPERTNHLGPTWREQCNDWVKAHVLPRLPPEGDPAYKARAVIASEVLAFVRAGETPPEFWGYYAAYDWVVFCWLFGRMADLPQGLPFLCMDLKQRMVERNYKRSDLPDQLPSEEHNALCDARWVRSALRFMNDDLRVTW